MMAEQVNLLQQTEWEAGPDEEIRIPEVYINQLRYEIVVFTAKKEFTFRCRDYESIGGNGWRFANVIIDTSKLDAVGDVVLKRVSYHPSLELINVPFMVVPAVESDSELASEPL